MQNCTLLSSTNYKGFGLDNIKFTVEDTPYSYDVPSDVRAYITRLAIHKPFKALMIAKRLGVLVNREYV